MNKQVKIVQLVDTSMGIYGLDKDGNVWVYQGHKHGWGKLNMKQMTAKELKSKFE